MKNPLLAQALFSALIHAEIAVWNRLEHELWATPNAATLGRFLTLKTIAAAAPHAVRINDIAVAQHITLSAASRLVDRLVTDGLVDREPDPTDRRATALRITDEGRIRLDASSVVFERAVHDLVEDFDPDVISSLTDSLTRLAVTAESAFSSASRTPAANKRSRSRAITRPALSH
ncbi:MarR family winged helix-turn-helix transcriptional regulator [Actinomyces mediterranea]|uniref:MarR family winged helix-turn-helix transcriptional regulator n=1 Tax=Actinomyces mediterranea TaxID=1871028 RepID=UPI0009712691|nr:MarR family transcriptional regulator [Actinomyces mediterranea]